MWNCEKQMLGHGLWSFAKTSKVLEVEIVLNAALL